VPQWDTQTLFPNGAWSISTGDGGQVSEGETDNYLNSLTISSNPMRQEALASIPLQIVLDNVISDPSVEGFPYDQYNYQISFEMAAEIVQNTNLISSTIYDGITVSSKEIDNLVSAWIDSNFDIVVDEGVKNQPVYTQSNNKFVIGKRNNVFDRVVPILGAYENSNPSVDFQIKILKNDNNLKDFTIGLMFEKTHVTATNIENVENYINRGYKRNTYIPSWTETVYTGRAKFAAFVKTEGASNVRADYVMVREFPEVLEVSELASYSIIMNYTSIESEDVANMLGTIGQTYADKFVGSITMLINDTPKFSQSFITTLNDDDYNYFDIGFGVPSGGYYIADKISPSKLGVFDDVSSIIRFSSISITSPSYEYNSEIVTVPTAVRDILELKVGDELSAVVPSGAVEYLLTDEEKNELLTLNFRDKNTTLYSLSADSSTGATYTRSVETDGADLMSVEFNSGSNEDRIIISTSDGELYDTGFITTAAFTPFKFDIDISSLHGVDIQVESGSVGSTWDFTIYFKKSHGNNSFMQVPITIEGTNQSVDIDMGIYNDIHLAWQSNRDRYWDIFYSHSGNKLSPFRFETAITDTESNSLKPSVSICRSGVRMISWHDNRKGNYNVYVARSLDGESFSEDACEKTMLEEYDNVIECSLSIDHEVIETGIHNFRIEFYHDVGLKNLHKTISIEDTTSRWFMNGVSISNSLVYDDDTILGVNLIAGDIVTILLTPDRSDDIFDMVLYAKLAYDLN
jgi:hypothetical protein